jgi:predicted transporter
VLVSAACLTTAARVADQPSGDRDAQLLYGLSDSLWAVGSVFFGLWLVPMGIAVLRSGWGPRVLGRLLVVGGVGYLLSAFVASALPDVSDAASTVLVVPATVGELWMVGWLLLRGAGVRRVR